MARYKTFANSGSFTPNDVNVIREEIDISTSRWRTLFAGGFTTWAAGPTSYLQPSAPWALNTAGGTTLGGVPVGGVYTASDSLSNHLIPIENYGYGPNRKAKIRYEVISVMTLAGLNFGANPTIALYAVVGYGHAQTSGSGWVTAKVSATSVPGTAFTIAEPVINTKNRVLSGEMPMPVTGMYILGLTVDQAPNNGPDLLLKATIQWRTVRVD